MTQFNVGFDFSSIFTGIPLLLIHSVRFSFGILHPSEKSESPHVVAVDVAVVVAVFLLPGYGNLVMKSLVSYFTLTWYYSKPVDWNL